MGTIYCQICEAVVGTTSLDDIHIGYFCGAHTAQEIQDFIHQLDGTYDDRVRHEQIRDLIRLGFENFEALTQTQKIALLKLIIEALIMREKHKRLFD